MQWIYFDASALIKRYSEEIGTPLLNELFRHLPVSRMACPVIGILEVISIFVRKRNDGRLSQSLFEQAMIEFRAEVIDYEDFLATTMDEALMLSSQNLIVNYNLNATDAIVLRSALTLKQTLQMQGDALFLWTSDKKLVRAAQNEGLAVFDPEVETIVSLHRLLGISSEIPG